MAPGSARPRSTPTWSSPSSRRWPKAPGSPPSNSGTSRVMSSLDPHTDTSQDIATHGGPTLDARPAWAASITRPLKAFRLRYVPVVMVYFAYGALGLIDVTRDLWI